MVYLTSFDKLQ